MSTTDPSSLNLGVGTLQHHNGRHKNELYGVLNLRTYENDYPWRAHKLLAILSSKEREI